MYVKWLKIKYSILKLIHNFRICFFSTGVFLRTYNMTSTCITSTMYLTGTLTIATNILQI